MRVPTFLSAQSCSDEAEMGLQQRRVTGSQTQEKSSAHDVTDSFKAKSSTSPWIKNIWIFCLLLIGMALVRMNAGPSPGLPIIGKNHVLHLRQLSPHAEMRVSLSRDDPLTNLISLGPHTVDVWVSSPCPYPRFFLRLHGSALVHILMRQNSRNERQWQGTFHIPVNGTYELEARWYGCRPQDTQSFTSLTEPLAFRASGSDLSPLELKELAVSTDYASQLLARNIAWMSTNSMRIGETKLPPYLVEQLHDDQKPEPGSFVRTAESLVYQGGILGPDGYYQFGEVGNYELVCFMGSHTMQKIWRTFLDMRGQLFSYQRPFKFHMYDIYSFIKPDSHWEIDTKKRLRKCKHILLALDEFQENLSQKDYMEQVFRFVNVHLQKVIPDKTFPIWVLSVNEPPMNTTNCFQPILTRTTDHPCNDALKHLFRSEPPKFADRIHFLDNTDLTLPQFDLNQADIFANIALRLYVIVGKGVSDWRHMGQSGKVDGLHRNGTVEPNFELVPYEGWD